MRFSERGNSYWRNSRDSDLAVSRDSDLAVFRGSGSGSREMYTVICSDCGVETEVPFKPIE